MLSHVFISTQQQVSADYILSVLHQLSAALLYCHTGLTVGAEGAIRGNSFDWNPVLHRDIKPGNSKW
jgi:serine/threonine protein kinase